MKKTLLLLFVLSISQTMYSQTVWAPINNIDNVGALPYAIASGDLNGDLAIDIIVGTYNFSDDYIKWYKNNGNLNPTFDLQPNVYNDPAFLGISGIAIANLDHDIATDNGNDIIASSYNDNKIVWFKNDGSANPVFTLQPAISTTLTGAGQVVTADINNDNLLDVIAVGYDSNKVVWFAGDGLGGFGSENLIDDPVNYPGLITLATFVSFYDFDDDGDLDALISYEDATTDGTIEIYYNQYIESTTNTVSWLKDEETVNSGNPYLFTVAFADVDKTDNIDIIKSDNTTGEVAWYSKVKNGDVMSHPISDNSIIARPAIVAVADFDNDMHNDVVLTDGGSNDDAIIWFESTDTDGVFNTEALIADHNYQLYGITINDFDNDGDQDIASIGWANGSLDWYENERETLSLSNNQLNEFSIYPNPANNVLNFKVPFKEGFKISVYDVLGKQVLNTTLKADKSLDISNLNNGIYILKFDDYNTNFKFIKQ